MCQSLLNLFHVMKYNLSYWSAWMRLPIATGYGSWLQLTQYQFRYPNIEGINISAYF